MKQSRRKGLKAKSHATLPNTTSPYKTIGEERDGRVDAVTGQLRILKTQLPLLLKRLNKISNPRNPKKIKFCYSFHYSLCELVKRCKIKGDSKGTEVTQLNLSILKAMNTPEEIFVVSGRFYDRTFNRNRAIWYLSEREANSSAPKRGTPEWIVEECSERLFIKHFTAHSAEEMARQLVAAKLPSGCTVTLVSCNTAVKRTSIWHAWEKPFAQKLREHLMECDCDCDCEVVGRTGLTEVNKQGQVRTRKSNFYQLFSKDIVFKTPLAGKKRYNKSPAFLYLSLLCILCVFAVNCSFLSPCSL